MLTFSIVLEGLQECFLDGTLDSRVKQRQFSDVTLASLADEVSLGEGWLHVASGDDAESFLVAHPDAALLRVIPNGVDAGQGTFSKRRFPACVTVRSNLDAMQVYLQARTIFHRIGAWLSKVQQIYQAHGSYQDVLEVSEEIVGNLVTMSDSSYRLLAHTPDTTTADRVQAQLLALGHHGPEVVRLFNDLDLPRYWRKSSSEVQVTMTSEICSFPTVGHVFRYRNSYFVHIVMLCERVGVSYGLIDRFKLLIHALEPFVRRDWDDHKGFAQPHDRLFETLLEKERPTEQEIAGEAALLGIPFTDSYRLGYIETVGVDELGIDGIAWQLVELLPDHFVTLYQDAVLVLFRGYHADRAVRDPGLRFLDSLAERGVCLRVGVSSSFSGLTDFDLAFRQAQYACKVADGAGEDSDGGRAEIAVFDDHLAEYVLHAFESDVRMAQFCLSWHPVAHMFREDAERGTRTFQILKTYLETECRASAAAEKLHMHRNNVTYHIERIEQRYDLDLDNPETRFEALLVAHLLGE